MGTSGSKDSSKSSGDDSGSPRRLPTIPVAGGGVNCKGKSVHYPSEPVVGLNFLPTKDDNGEYAYIGMAFKKDGATDKDGAKDQGLTDSMRKMKTTEIEYELMGPNSGFTYESYVIPMEPSNTSNGVAPPVVEQPNEEPPLGMTMPGKMGMTKLGKVPITKPGKVGLTMPGKVPKTIEASHAVGDSIRDSKPEIVKPTEVQPPGNWTWSRAEEEESTNAKHKSVVTMQAENAEYAAYKDVSAAEDSDDEGISPTPHDYEAIPAKGAQ